MFSSVLLGSETPRSEVLRLVLLPTGPHSGCPCCSPFQCVPAGGPGCQWEGLGAGGKAWVPAGLSEDSSGVCVQCDVGRESRDMAQEDKIVPRV